MTNDQIKGKNTLATSTLFLSIPAGREDRNRNRMSTMILDRAGPSAGHEGLQAYIDNTPICTEISACRTRISYDIAIYMIFLR